MEEIASPSEDVVTFIFAKLVPFTELRVQKAEMKNIVVTIMEIGYVDCISFNSIVL